MALPSNPDAAGGPLPGCLIISGLPGAGKTTVSRLVAARLPRSARLDGDDVANMIVNGRVRVDQPGEESRRQLRLRARNLCALAASFARDGFTPVIDHVVPDRDVLAFMAGGLRPLPVMFVVLAPPLEVCRRRNLARPARERVDFDFGPLDRSMREELDGTGWWLDTAAMTPEDTADAITAHARRRALVAA
ncbi:AAA family ATPase [Actinomadura rubrisoli]|uniref:Phosphotransferase n=1 Tax=Actinomadura rubrisoli TaxID=2530368 RepID=A0A4R5AC53_9ACTN|nr:AAA family ATPase [Actinomadura rubrisoli]TDD68816.1 phosphotransferase [Actinomadura rubrisoli]